MAICFVIAWPISKLLDCMLGPGHLTVHSRAELKALVGLHGPVGYGSTEQTTQGHDSQEILPLTQDEVMVIKVFKDILQGLS